MHPSRRRKKHPNYGIRTVEVLRGSNGFGFTISGQQPCILSCIVTNSPADLAGLRAGDFLISVNGISVSKITHDAVVNLIGNCVGPIRMTIAENYYSDSSEEELDVNNRMINTRKPKYMHKPRTHRFKQTHHRPLDASEISKKCDKHLSDAKPALHYVPTDPGSSSLIMDDEAGPIEYKALVGYLGTIEMPNQLQPNSRLQTVCSCIRKLRQEKRAPTAVLMTIFPTCLTLKNSSNHILAIYPTNRVVYIGSTTDRESRYFGLVTSAVCDARNTEKRFEAWPHSHHEEKKFNNTESELEVSNSCHVFMIDPKIVEHSVHVKKAESFKITCTADIITGSCLEFPRNSLYIVNLVQNMYKLQTESKSDEVNLGPIVANSPQPSASSNSDSGIGFRDDCGNVSDRILVVEFPAHRSFPLLSNSASQRPAGIDASSIQLESLDLPLKSDNLQNIEMNNIRCKNSLEIKVPNNLSKNETKHHQHRHHQMNNLNNIRACGSVNIKNVLEKSSDNIFLIKQNNDSDAYNYRLTCRAMPDRAPVMRNLRELSPTSVVSSDDNNTRMADIDTGQIFSERAIDVVISENETKNKYEEDLEFQSSVDNVSMHSSTSAEMNRHHFVGDGDGDGDGVFKLPPNAASLFGLGAGGGGRGSKKSRRGGGGGGGKLVNSCDNLDKVDDTIMKYKLSPKVYGLAKPNHSCEELNNLDSSIEIEKFGYGSLQELNKWSEVPVQRKIRNVAQSEPDVRIQRIQLESDGGEENGFDQNENGAASWSQSFEKLLDDPMGLHTFAEFVKKEFSAENIYFWTACERYRKLPQGPERLSEAQRIFTQHLAIGAPEGVNVDAHARRCTEHGVLDPSDTLFDLAQKQIFNLMKLDSYQRFLKSDLYKQCLTGDVERPHQFDTRLMVHSASSPKLKKSVSNAEDVRRKSYLPWHRKNRSKSKDRGETEYNNQCRSDIICNNNNNNSSSSGKLLAGSEIHSSKSSLTSLDLALSLSQEGVKGSQDEISSVGRNALCKIIFSNEITSVVQIKPSETIEQMVRRLLEKRGFQYSVFEIYTNKHPKSLDISESSLKLSGCEVTIEQRVVFKLDLPNKKVISVKSKATKIIADVLKPILFKYNYNLDYARVTIGGGETNESCYVVDINLPVTSIDEKRLNIQYCEMSKSVPGNPLIKVNDVKVVASNQQEITNQVFKVIQQEKAEAVFRKPKSDKGSVKSEDWGSEHSSGIIGRFLRRGSGLHDAKKKFLTQKKDEPAPPPTSSSEQLIKKPVIAKLKAGVNKLHVACSESDELVEGLTRAQKSRLEDQRGTEINFELPDFLKDNNEKTARDMNSRFYLGGHCNYENRSVLPKDFHNNNNNNNSSFVQTTNYSSISEDSSSSSPPSPSKEKTKLTKAESPKCDPPPLPPKPKNVPRKPPNWGQNGHRFDKELSSSNNKTLYLEKSTSSFV